MPTEALFSISESGLDDWVTFTFEGVPVTAPAGISVAAALLISGAGDFRTSIVGQTPRAAYCMMGVCFECLVDIDGVPARQSCLVPVRQGMAVQRQKGAADLYNDIPGDQL